MILTTTETISGKNLATLGLCLLYTSDAADE